ncbi:alpha/beta fold hydrolase [Pleomorphovibrio marinus]|uniref:alpha/beta fold hydrolase n=1 Tax=Pleomorphovibrio marinus TaxID=2164132 RepID=UPI000E0B7918|nr:alpha/beta hydrolase [Pleomorphovibrio marinus]
MKNILSIFLIAGDEITKFASTYPNKVNQVICLDAAYDRSNFVNMFDPYMPSTPTPTAEDLSSFENYRCFLKNIYGVSIPDEEIKSISVFSEEGIYLNEKTSYEIGGKIMLGVERPNYGGILCPALAIYAFQTTKSQVFPFYDSLDEKNRIKADTLFTIISKYDRDQIKLFEKEVKKGSVKKITGANHYLYLSHPDETEAFIRDFLIEKV